MHNSLESSHEPGRDFASKKHSLDVRNLDVQLLSTGAKFLTLLRYARIQLSFRYQTLPSELTDEFMDRLHAAGCDDGTPYSTQGAVAVDFTRKAKNFAAAIARARSQVSAAGGDVKFVEVASRMN